MDCFLNLPTDLACNVLADWLCRRSVVSLDSAYCNGAKRRVLLETVFRAPQYIMNDLGWNSFQWIMLRGIRVRSLKVTNFVNTVSCRNYLRKFGNCVQEVLLDGCDETKLAAIVHCTSCHCKNVRRLELSSCSIDDIVLRLIPNFKILDELSIDFCRNLLESHDILLSAPPTDETRFIFLKSLIFNFSQELIQYAFRYARGIEKLCTTYPRPIPSYPSLVNLKVLYIKYYDDKCLADDSLIRIVQHCSMIVHLNVQYFRALSDASGVVIARDLLNLKTLLADLCGFTDLTLKALATHRSDTLEILSTTGCDFITAEGYSAVLQRCHKLHTVQLSTSHVDEYNAGWNNVTHMKLRCSATTHASTTFNTIMCNCCKLQHLEISYVICDQIDFTVLQHTVPQLRELNICESGVWFETCNTQNELRRNIVVVRPELKVEFVNELQEARINVMKLSV